MEETTIFGVALMNLQIKQCLYIRLPHWKKDVKIKIQRPDKHSKMTAPYLYVESRNGLVPWIPTMIELLSEQWERHN